MTQPVLWHGRIDDRYLTFGTQRPAATRHDLADALNAALAGRQPAPVRRAPRRLRHHPAGPSNIRIMTRSAALDSTRSFSSPYSYPL